MIPIFRYRCPRCRRFWQSTKRDDTCPFCGAKRVWPLRDDQDDRKAA